ncbi:hypothetical protein M1446_05065 [Candidatus Dependentiae bacterium]|nr:hypothetical protein [Candidatus Dependentiae bacterium]
MKKILLFSTIIFLKLFAMEPERELKNAVDALQMKFVTLNSALSSQFKKVDQLTQEYQQLIRQLNERERDLISKKDPESREELKKIRVYMAELDSLIEQMRQIIYVTPGSKAVQEILPQLENENRRLKKENETLKSENQNLKTNNEKFKERWQEAQKKATEYGFQNVGLQKTLEQMATEEGAKPILDLLKAQSDFFQKQIKELNEKINETKKECEKKLTERQKEIGQAAAILIKNAELQADVDRLKNELRLAQEEINRLKQK